MNTTHQPQVVNLKSEIEQTKRSRNALQRQLKQEGAAHNLDKRRLEVSIPLIFGDVAYSDLFFTPLLFIYF